jgi:hypothetical protein
MLGFYNDIAKIKNNSVVIYRKWEGDKTKKMRDVDLTKNFLGKMEVGADGEFLAETIPRLPYCGQMTHTARKRMIECIELFSSVITDRWIYNKFLKKRVKHKFSFITLTIPEQSRRITGREGYNTLLEPFIFWLVKTKKVNTYIWKGELQSPLDFQGRIKVCKGQLHYHLILPNFIDWKEIRRKWNYLLKINDLLGGHENPPSTSIERPFKGKYVADYIIKEISKNCQSTKKQKELGAILKQAEVEAKEHGKFGCMTLLNAEMDVYNEFVKEENESLGGKVWGCSRNLSPKKVLKKDADLQCLEDLKVRIREYEDSLKKMENDEKRFERREIDICPNPDRYSWEKAQLNFCKKKSLEYYERQKNFFEVEITDIFFRKLEFTMSDYERRGDWRRNGNIWDNEFVAIYRFPMDYKDMLLDCNQHVWDSDGNLQKVLYKKSYNQWLVDRVGIVYTEKTTRKFINKYENSAN